MRDWLVWSIVFDDRSPDSFLVGELVRTKLGQGVFAVGAGMLQSDQLRLIEVEIDMAESRDALLFLRKDVSRRGFMPRNIPRRDRSPPEPILKTRGSASPPADMACMSDRGSDLRTKHRDAIAGWWQREDVLRGCERSGDERSRVSWVFPRSEYISAEVEKVGGRIEC